jgi:transposase
MPWREVSLMALREEFGRLSKGSEMSFSELCQRYSISRKTGYKWVSRYLDKGSDGFHSGQPK